MDVGLRRLESLFRLCLGEGERGSTLEAAIRRFHRADMFGVEVTHSSPRITWLISIKWSSTTVGEMVGGETIGFEKDLIIDIGLGVNDPPFYTSSKTHSPVSGTLRRYDLWLAGGFSRSATSEGLKLRYRRS